MKIWIYGKDEQDIKRIAEQLAPNVNILVGITKKSKPGALSVMLRL